MKASSTALFIGVVSSLALIASAGLPGGGGGIDPEKCVNGQTYTSICTSMTTQCSAFGVCDICDTSHPIDGMHRECRAEEGTCVRIHYPPQDSKVSCGPRKTGICQLNNGQWQCAGATPNGDCFTAKDECSNAPD